MIGQTVSHYRILEKLGGGGMGVVYKAEDTKLKREVALKFLPPELTRDENAKKRFVHEAQAASALQHHNICTIHEIGEADDGRLFICMDCYDGETLRNKIAKGPLSVTEGLKIAQQVADGLSKAHAKGMVHRDVKPANIMVTADGVVKILDFGLAKLAGQTKLTKTGSTVGTVSYMSPQQARGEDLDARSDVFSLGAVLYELLAGAKAFKGDHDAAVLYGIVHNDPEPMATYRSDVPDDVSRVIDSALRKEASNRYQDAAELAAELRRVRTAETNPTQSTATASNARRRNLTIGVVSILVLALGYLAYSRYVRPDSSETQVRHMIAILPFENLGSADDEYFADGMTEEITARLAGVSELGVIARMSAMQYKNTDKSVQQVGAELGVDYIMEGTIRWQQSPGGGSRVRVTPQLIRVSDATHVWADVYDEELVEVFRVQSNIAEHVVNALGVTLLDRERKLLESVPTDNFEAYGYYLRAEQKFEQYYVESSMRDAVDMYKKAVELDSLFAVAHARLSEAHAIMYQYNYDQNPSRKAAAKSSADTALRLQPNLPEAHIAAASCYYRLDNDYDRALEHLETARDKQPSNARIFEIMGYTKRRQGRFVESLKHLRRASELDPRNADIYIEVGWAYSALRDYTQATRFYRHCISLDPEHRIAHVVQIWCHWLAGDRESARKALKLARDNIEDDEFLLDEILLVDIYDREYHKAMKRLSSIRSESVVDISSWFSSTAEYRAHVLGLMGQIDDARAQYDSARTIVEARLELQPDVPKLHAALGIAYAGMGRKEQAIAEGKLAVNMLPLSRDAMLGYSMIVRLAHIYTLVGEYDDAVDQLEILLKHPGDMSVGLLRLDPRWDPLREHPRFQHMLEKHTKQSASG